MDWNEIILKNLNFRLYECCIPVRGYRRAIIYDLQRIKFNYVPLGIVEILEKYNGCQIGRVLDNFKEDEKLVIQEYFEFLISEDYIFFTRLNDQHFPKLEEKFEKPFNISNLIIDVSKTTISQLEKISHEIDELGCESLMLRYFKSDNFENQLYDSLKVFNESSVQSIELVSRDYNIVDEEFINQLCSSEMKIMKYVLFDADEDLVKILEPANILLVKTKSEISESSRHEVDVLNFNVNLDLYMELKLFNAYYNKKVFIDGFGNIRNSPESHQFFGNIQDNSIKEVLSNQEFKKLWYIQKDSIKKCKDCEYRYMCVDSSELYSMKGEWIQKSKCNYDPYTAKWNKIAAE